MGCGKSTIGNKLAKTLNWSFYDLDKIIENKYNNSIYNLFNLLGEDEFREIEFEALKELKPKNNSIISTGGGSPCFNENLVFMKEHGLTIYIKQSIDVLCDRLFFSGNKRPLLNYQDKNSLKTNIENILKQRECYYNQAHYTLEGINITANDIINIINDWEKKI